MVIVNTTFHVSKPLAKDFIKWVKEEYVPSALRENMVSPRLTEIFGSEDSGAVSYAFSLTTRNFEDAHKWHDGNVANRLRHNLSARYGEDILYFTTFMQTVPLFD